MSVTPLERAKRYAANVPPAIEGAGGDNATYRFFLLLFQRFGAIVKYSELWEVVQDWNQHCQPPWQIPDLQRKFEAARRKVSPDMPIDRPLSRSDMTPTHVKKAKGRLILRAGSRADLDRLSELRGIPVESLQRAAALGFLSFGKYAGHECWFVHHELRNSVAQARRMDGEPFEQIGVKAWTIVMGEGLGRKMLGLTKVRDSENNVILTEGGPDLLSAIHLFPNHRCLSLLGAWIIIMDDEAKRLAGKDITIFADKDDAGISALTRWSGTLLGNGVRSVTNGWALDGFQGVEGDLNDYLIQTSAEYLPF